MRFHAPLMYSLLLLSGISSAQTGKSLYPAEQIQGFLSKGRLAQGELLLTNYLQDHPHDAQARLGLGAIQFLLAAERFGQAYYRHGCLDGAVLLYPVPYATGKPSDDPQPVSYDDQRDILQILLDDLKRTDATLADITDPEVKLQLSVGEIRLDLDGDGIATDEEQLRHIYTARGRHRGDLPAERLISFDIADVHWFRGQCHLYMAFCEFMLAHDFEKMWNHLSPFVFAKPRTPFMPLVADPGSDWQDGLAFLHLIDWPVKEPQRMKRTLEHLETLLQQIELCLDALEKEGDDDHEWLAGPGQTGAFPAIALNKAAVKNWRSLLKHLKAMLAGDELLPLIRDYPNWGAHGANLRRVFLEPRRFDLVLWLQGAAAKPYLEEGKVNGQFWVQLVQGLFSGNMREFGILPL